MTALYRSKKFWKKQAKDLIIISLVSLPWAYLACSECFSDSEKLVYLISINFAIWVVMWKGNSYVNYLVDQYYSWLKEPVKRLIIGILAHTVFTSVSIVLIFYMFQFLLDITIGNIRFTLTFSIVVTMLVSLVLNSITFLNSWRMLAVESERMKKEVITSKYESLKNQVNPHFLFNSLNALSNLVYEDQDQAAKFIKKLSAVYRYVLESRNKDLVDINTELKFAASYLFLQKIRFGDSLQIADQSPVGNYSIPPLSVQMLLENAIKHNVVSKDEPLSIRIYENDGYLMVENNLQKKNIIKGDSSQMGLDNIKARYGFFTDKPVIIEQDREKFIVGLPLLQEA